MLTHKNKFFFIQPSICGLFHGSATLSLSSVDTSNLVNMRKKENIEESGASLGKLTQSLMPFATAKIGNFFQSGPELKNQYTQDALLKSYLRRHVPDKVCPIANYLAVY